MIDVHLTIPHLFPFQRVPFPEGLAISDWKHPTPQTGTSVWPEPGSFRAVGPRGEVVVTFTNKPQDSASTRAFLESKGAPLLTAYNRACDERDKRAAARPMSVGEVETHLRWMENLDD